MRRGGPAPMLAADALESDDSDEDTDYALSASGHAFNFKGIAGMYSVTREGMTVHPAAAEGMPDSIDRVNLRCDYSDIDMQNAPLLGSGASGKVIEVRHKPSGHRLALKRIRVGDEAQMQAIKRELDTLYIDNHPNIINFFGAFWDSGNIQIALELMDGSLSDCIRLSKGIPETVTRACTRQVLQGLVYLHKQRHVVHRDIKPSNLLFSRDGSIKITDFGISAALLESRGCANTFVGTVTFMSPERLAGEKYSYSADIWSLGLSLILLATGEHPFAKVDEHAGSGDGDRAGFWNVLRCIEEEEPPTLPADRIFSTNFRSLVTNCMKKSAEERWGAVQLMSTPFVAELTDEDAVAICQEGLRGVVKRIRHARKKEAKETSAMAEQLLGAVGVL